MEKFLENKMVYETIFSPRIAERIICNIPNKKINSSQLSRLINSTQSSIAISIKKLESIGIINIKRKKGKRQNPISLTDKGIEVRNHFLKIRELCNG